MNVSNSRIDTLYPDEIANNVFHKKNNVSPRLSKNPLQERESIKNIYSALKPARGSKLNCSVSNWPVFNYKKPREISFINNKARRMSTVYIYIYIYIMQRKPRTGNNPADLFSKG